MLDGRVTSIEQSLASLRNEVAELRDDVTEVRDEQRSFKQAIVGGVIPGDVGALGRLESAVVGFANELKRWPDAVRAEMTQERLVRRAQAIDSIASWGVKQILTACLGIAVVVIGAILTAHFVSTGGH